MRLVHVWLRLRRFPGTASGRGGIHTLVHIHLAKIAYTRYRFRYNKIIFSYKQREI